MTRREALASLAAVGLAGTVGRRAGADDPKAPEEMTVAELVKSIGGAMAQTPIQVASLGSGLSLISGPGGNVAASVGPDGILLVDSFVPGRGGALLATVRADRPDAPIVLVNSHWHFDHTGGNVDLGQAGARIMAHDTVRTRLGADQFMSDLEMTIPKSPAKALPVVTISDQATLHHNGEEIHLQHVPPAHTDGDIFVHFRRANVLHTGDLFTHGAYPFIDSSSAGWITGMVRAVDLLLGVVDDRTTIIPGHGPVARRADLVAYRGMLAGVRDVVQPLVEAGKTLPEVIAARPTAPFDARFGQQFIKGRHFTELAYNGLKKYHSRGQS